MKYLLLILCLVAIQEKATLNTPINLGTVIDYQVTDVAISRPKTIGNLSGNWALRISYSDNQNRSYFDEHVGIFDTILNPNGADIMVKALNKANLNPAAGGKTLNCRAIEHLQSEGKIPASTNSCIPE